jgi:hypothetical protein
MPRPPDRQQTIAQAFREGTVVDEALRKAAHEALLRHKQAGCPVAVWRNGKVVWVPAEDIHLPGDRRAGSRR